MSIEQQIIERGIFIPGEVPSSKNSKEIGFFFKKQGSTGTMFYLKAGLDPKDPKNYKAVQLNLNSSKTTKRYIKEKEWDYIGAKVAFQKLLVGKEKPYRLCFQFTRGTKRKFDYINAAQIVQDLMVKYGWIDDDDCVNVRPYFLEYKVDKNSPGVLISIF